MSISTALRTLVVCAATIGAGALTPATAVAQRASDSTTITLVSARALPGNAATTVLRRDSLPRDIILVDLARATGDDLGAALALMHAMRAQNELHVRAVPSSFTAGPAWRNGASGLSQAWLTRLRKAPNRQIEGIGRRPAIDVRIGRSRGRFSQKHK